MVRVSAAAPARARRPGPRQVAIALGSIAAAIAVAAAIGAEAAGQALRRRTGAASTAAALRAVALAPLRLAQARGGGGSVDRIAIDIKFKHLHKIHDMREEALRNAAFVSSDADYVPAELTVNGAVQRGFLRLDHESGEDLRGEKWPLRVRTRGDAHVLGFRRFRLRSPAARDLLSERLFQEELRRQDILAPRIRYVDVSRNGKHIGMMTLEELPASELLESLQRRDGPVLRLLAPPMPGTAVEDVAYTAPLQPLHIERSRKLRRHHKTARRLMRGYLVGSLAAADIFDTEITGRYLALAELWGAAAMLERAQQRFYYNPLTARFEPVGSPAVLSPARASANSVVRQAAFASRLLDDPRVRAAFDASLARFAAAAQTQAFGEELAARGRAPLRRLHRDRPLRAPFDATALRQRAAQLHALPIQPGTPAAPPVPRSRAAAPTLPLPSPATAELLARHPFLSWHAEGGEFRAAPGRWDVDGSLILPDAAGLALAPGTLLRFQAKQGIIARGPLTFLGSAEEPIVLEGPLSPKRSERWAGVYVVESARPSRWTHVTVRNTGGFKRNGWFLAGGVVFRKAPVELLDCSFNGNLSDDALNIIRTSFSMTNPTIVDSLSDGFDGDYVDGTIAGGLIARAGGDAIDVGGSSLSIRGTQITDVRDKAISVGERSRVKADTMVIARSGIAVASKNGSHTRITGSTIDDVSDVALVAYTNRPEYGPGVLAADGNHITRATLTALAQSGSRVIVDGAAVPEIDAAIDQLYKEGETDR